MRLSALVSSGGWKIPDTVVPDSHCSTRASGWLQGSHPSVGNGEVTRTVCFNKAGNRCHKTQEIKIENCSSYFVYELKPPPDCEAVYCTVTDSALTDPCVNHTVLDQPWRSSDCDDTRCSSQVKCDDGLHFGWYRFKSSGGWKIPETAVPHHHCSTHVTSWLQGSHPSVGEGEVTRTVCLYWGSNHCDKVHEIKIKNCSSYFVYELKSLFHFAAYCTDPETATTEEPVEQSTRESTRGSSSTPAVSGTSEPMTSQTQESEEQSTGESTEVSSSIPVGSGTPEPVTYQTQESEEQSTAESTEGPSSIPAGSGSSEPVTSKTQESEEQSTRESTEVSSSTPAGSGSSVLDPPTKRNSFSLTTLSSSLLIMNILLKSRLNRLFSTENSPSFSDLFMSLTSLIPGTILFFFLVGVVTDSAADDVWCLPSVKADSGIPSTPEEPPDSQPVSDDDTKYKRINVKITSMTDLDDETAKRIVVERMSFRPHIHTITKTVHFHLHTISRLRPCLSSSAAETLIRVSVTSSLDYSNALLAKLTSFTLPDLILIQTFAVS
ncbi:uncharacterized protein [Heterodontus francisci]|uniref:uncharacterized protein n=1 Tax=Heterodontus francisci TaxID=7792 RepID=UPI00355B4D22